MPSDGTAPHANAEGAKFRSLALVESVDTQIIYFEGHVAAVATEVGVIFAAWVHALERDDPIWRFIAAAAACAYDVVNGALAGPYTEALGTAYARGAFIGADRFDRSDPSGMSSLYPPSTVRNV